MAFVTGGAEEPPAAGDEVEDEHFAALSAVLEAHADLLERKAEELVANGMTAIRTRKGELRAWLRMPSRWRSGELRVTTAEGPAEEVRPRVGRSVAGSIVPIGRGRDPGALRQEIVGQLANWLVDIADE